MKNSIDEGGARLPEEEIDDNLSFVLYTEASGTNYPGKEISEDDLIIEDTFCPPEGHCLASKLEGNKLSLYMFGGYCPESVAKSASTNSLFMSTFVMDESGLVYQEKGSTELSNTLKLPSFKFWLKNQVSKSMIGSFLPSLSNSSMCFVDENLYIFMGFER